MMRLAFANSASRPAVYGRACVFSHRIALQHIRHESSKVDQGRQELFNARNELRRDWKAEIVTYEELKPKTLQPSSDKYLIDVREPDEVLQGSIPSAVNIPLSVLSNALHLPATEFKEKFGFEKPGQEQELTFYCRSGVRSSTASDVARRNGYSKILNYKGSWLEWIEREGRKHPT